MLKTAAVLAFTLLAPAAALAHESPAAEGYGPPAEALLPAPPADAPPGVCYAHVRVPGRPVSRPPMGGGMHWELRPPPPGAIGPVWCLVPDAPVAMTLSPAREGWIRVQCNAAPPPPCRPCEVRRPVRLHDGWLSWPGKRYF